MSDRKIVGTPRKVVLDGNLFNPTADADFSDGKPPYEITALVSSGANFWQVVKQNQDVEGISVRVTGDELEILKELTKRLVPFPMSYTNAADDTYKAQGMIQYQNRKGQTGVVDLKLIPDENGWELF
jgi:hypothetical protein